MDVEEVPYIDVHTHRIPSSETWAVYNWIVGQELPEFTHGFLSTGIHPWYIPENWDESLLSIIDLAQTGKLSAIGECGLDRTITTDFDLQKQVFLAHQKQSETFALPLIIHSVKSYSDIAAFRKSLRPSQGWILHDYFGNAFQTAQLAALGCWFSISPRHLHKSSFLPNIPMNRLLLETDDFEQSIQEHYEQVSRQLKLSLPSLKAQLFTNFQIVFKQK